MQPINKNYFQLFNIPESCELDLDSLASTYRELQSESHPDRFASADEHAKMQAVQLSSYLNEAYDTLKSPLKRSAYLLILHQQDIEQVNQSDLSMDLLLEQIRLRETLEELPEDESALAELVKIKNEVTTKLEDCHQNFAGKMNKNNYDGAKKIYHEMQFLYKLLAEIDSAEEQRLGY